MKNDKIRNVVRESYGKIAKEDGSCCGSAKSPCNPARDISKKIGYTEKELKTVPQGANLGLGCGNPVALASLKKGETVGDLGSGAGFDCFLAANKVGKNGKVIGIDMTPEMVEKARANAEKGRYKNVEFRLGEIENLPVADNFLDVIISNCVINLSPYKGKVFGEAFRALKRGGRLMVSDIVLLKKLPETVKSSVEAYIGCLSGAVMKGAYLMAIKKAGFREIRIIDETPFHIKYMANDSMAKALMKNLKISSEELKKAANSVASIKVYGRK